MKVIIYLLTLSISVYGGVVLFNSLLDHQIDRNNEDVNNAYNRGYNDGKKAEVILTDGRVVSWCDYIKMPPTEER